MQPISYPRHQFPPEIIRHTVWLYLRFALSYHDAGELLVERWLNGDVTLTANTILYSSRENLAPREINDLDCAKTDVVGQTNSYTQFM
jgi:transposase-like protein